MTDLFNLRKYEADGHAVHLYSTMLFFSTIRSPEHIYIHNKNNIVEYKLTAWPSASYFLKLWSNSISNFSSIYLIIILS